MTLYYLVDFGLILFAIGLAAYIDRKMRGRYPK